MSTTKTRTGGSRRKSTPKKAEKAEMPIVSFADAGAWATWLASHHARSQGVWLKIGKKGSGRSSVTYKEALDVAIAWGWIDGQKGKLDQTWWLQRFTPRRRRSLWSKLNCERARALMAEGKMRPPGLAEVESAKRDGRWEASYESQSRTTVPSDLAAALAANPSAASFFATLESRNRYAVLFRIHTAKKPETRARRIVTFVEMLARGEKLHP